MRFQYIKLAGLVLFVSPGIALPGIILDISVYASQVFPNGPRVKYCDSVVFRLKSFQAKLVSKAQVHSTSSNRDDCT